MSPLLVGRDDQSWVKRTILEAAPGSRVVSISPEGLADEPVDEVEVLLRGWTLGGDALDRFVGRAGHLRWIHSVSVGVESMLTPCVRLRGLTVTNGRGVFDRPIAEYVMAMVLAVARRLPQFIELQRERTWQPLESVELGSTTIGLLGLGGIGWAVAALAAPFGPRIVAIRRSRAAPNVPGVEVLGGREALPDLIAVSDFVVVALPLTPETEGIIDESALARFKRTAWLINVARGGLVDELALLGALRSGRIGGAVLDAFREEPLRETSPFYRLGNCIVTPHTSWWSPSVLPRSVEVFCDNLRLFRAGVPLRHPVDLAAGY